MLFCALKVITGVETCAESQRLQVVLFRNLGSCYESKSVDMPISGDISLATINNAMVRQVQNNSQGWQKAASLLTRGGMCHRMPPRGYGPVS